MAAERPLPEITPLTEPFWTAAREHRLLLQRCAACGRHQFPPEPGCTHCGGENLSWVEASGRARLYSWTVCHPPLLPYFAERAPWPVAAVELEEGPRLVSRLPDVPLDEYAFDMPLVAGFEDVDAETALVVFRRAQ